MNSQLLNLTNEEHDQDNIVDAMLGDKQQLNDLLSLESNHSPTQKEIEENAAQAADIIANYNHKHVLMDNWPWYIAHLPDALREEGIECHFTVNEWEAYKRKGPADYALKMT